MKSLITLGLLTTIISCSNASLKSGNNGTPAAESFVYPVAVSFGSICCGTPSPDFLKKFVVGFNRRNDSDISADIAAGCGREGEFVVLFKIPNIETLQRNFEDELRVLLEKTDAQNKKENSSSGGLALLKTTPGSDYKNFRLGIAVWEIK